MNLRSIFPGRFLLLALLILHAGLSVQAEIGRPPSKSDDDAPVATVPRPRGGTVEVERGGTVRIPLTIYGLTLEQVRFVIRQEPALGTLGEIQISDGSTSVVSYTHHGTPGETEDSFTFAARNSAGVSAPAKLHIRITDKPSLLIVPARVDFEALPVGSEQGQTITIENRGGGLARGVVSVSPPWRIEGDSRYETGPGETASFTAVFAPTQTGQQRSYVRYSSAPDRQTELRGRGISPFSVEPTDLTLDSNTRAGQIAIRNHTDRQLALSVQADPRLVVDEAVILEPQGEKIFMIAVGENVPEAFKAELVFERDSHRESVTVAAPAIPGALRLEPDQLGLLDPEFPRHITVTNVGGLPVKVSVDSPPGLTVEPSKFALAPGRQETLMFNVRKSVVSRGQVNLQYEGGTKELPFEVKASPPSPSPLALAESTPLPAFTPRPLEVEAMPSAEAMPRNIKTIDPANERDATLPMMQVISVSDFDRHSATLTWPAEPGLVYHVEQRHFGVRDGELHILWEAAPEDRPRTEGKVGTVRFTKLKSGQTYTVRLYGEDSAGAFTPPSAFVSFRTLPGPKFFPSFRTFLIIALIGLFGFVAYRRWRASQAA